MSDSDALKKLQEDVAISTRMLEKLPEYLQIDNLFFSMGPNIPALTLGGYLMRQHRTVALSDRLSLADQGQVNKNVARFQEIISTQVVRTEELLHKEYAARLRQWEAYLRDLRKDIDQHAPYYTTSVEPRLMIEEIDRLLATSPFRLNDEKLQDRLILLDGGLKGVWYAGGFALFEAWEPGYPMNPFWYLYGRPGRPKS